MARSQVPEILNPSDFRLYCTFCYCNIFYVVCFSRGRNRARGWTTLSSCLVFYYVSDCQLVVVKQKLRLTKYTHRYFNYFKSLSSHFDCVIRDSEIYSLIVVGSNTFNSNNKADYFCVNFVGFIIIIERIFLHNVKQS